MTLSADGDFWIFFFQGDWRLCHFIDWVFVSGSKLRTQILLTVTFWDRKVSPSASKRPNPEEITFLLVLCSSVRIQGTHVVHTFQDQIQDLEWCDYYFLCWLKEWMPIIELRCINPRERWHHHPAALQDQQIKRNGLSEVGHEAFFSCFGSRYCLHPATSGTSVDRNTSTNIAKTSVGVYHWSFLSNNVVRHITWFLQHISTYRADHYMGHISGDNNLQEIVMPELKFPRR